MVCASGYGHIGHSRDGMHHYDAMGVASSSYLLHRLIRILPCVQTYRVRRKIQAIYHLLLWKSVLHNPSRSAQKARQGKSETQRWLPLLIRDMHVSFNRSWKMARIPHL